MPKVFATQQADKDFVEAERFGYVEFLADTDLHNMRGSPHNERVAHAIRARLHDFQPSEDWILPVGSPYIIALVFLILGQMGVNHVNVLRWNNRDRRYTPMQINVRREHAQA